MQCLPFTRRTALLLVVSLLATLFGSLPAPAEDTYRFERMWPALPQPWYFTWAFAFAIDNEDYLYVLDSARAQVQKFKLDGH